MFKFVNTNNHVLFTKYIKYNILKKRCNFSTNSIRNHQMKIFNSLSNNVDLFEPKDDKNITWYSCGPTVYDSTHMGHARTYISIGI